MITRTSPACQTEIDDFNRVPAGAEPDADSDDWRKLLSESTLPVEQLLAQLDIPAQALDGSAVASIDGRIDTAPLSFSVRAPAPFIQRMEKGNINDPLLRQVLPVLAEQQPMPGYSDDPLQEAQANVAPGLIHKYTSRALLIVSKACAINCRYCFRRNFPYQDNQPSRAQWRDALNYLREHAAINEIIFSGGDPLACSDRHLRWLGQQLAAIPHIRRLRIHSRLPVVLPQRVDTQLLQWLESWPGQKVMVIHSNHTNEIDQQVAQAVTKLRTAGVTVLNQTVLLKGVNDSAAALTALSERLFDVGVMPYYLHMLDPVAGAAHFAIDDKKARQIVGEAAALLPGFLLPKLVRELPNKNAKTLIAPIQ